MRSAIGLWFCLEVSFHSWLRLFYSSQREEHVLLLYYLAWYIRPPYLAWWLKTKKNIPTESTQLSFWLRLAHLAWPYSLEYDHWVNDANDPITTTGIIFSLMARDNVRATVYNAQVAVKRGLQLLWLPWIRSPQTHSLKNHITLSNQNILLQFSPVATPQLRMHPYHPIPTILVTQLHCTIETFWSGCLSSSTLPTKNANIRIHQEPTSGYISLLNDICRN